MATMQESPALRRIVSIDALRGFDMFWIMGASSLAVSYTHLTLPTNREV